MGLGITVMFRKEKDFFRVWHVTFFAFENSAFNRFPFVWSSFTPCCSRKKWKFNFPTSISCRSIVGRFRVWSSSFVVPGQNIDQRKNVDATYPQMAARFFFGNRNNKGSSRLFPWLEVQKKKTNMQRYCNDHWTGTQLSGGVEKIDKKNSSDVSHLREMLLLILMNVLMAWRSTALDPCLSWKMRFWGSFFPVWKVRNLQKNQISQLRFLRQFRLKGSSHDFFHRLKGEQMVVFNWKKTEDKMERHHN